VTIISCYVNGVIRHPTTGVDGAFSANWTKPRCVKFFTEEIQLHELGHPSPPHPIA